MSGKGGERAPRILLVVAQLDVGGAEVQVVRLARELNRRGLRPEVATFYPDGALQPDLEQAGVPVHVLRRSTRTGLETIWDLRRLLRSERYDIVHSYLWPANWRSRIAAHLAGVPVVIASPRSIETWLTPVHVVVDRFLAGWTDAILVNAGAIRDFLVARERLPEDLFRVIHNGVGDETLQRIPDRETAESAVGKVPGRPMVLCLGNLQPEKNHEDFIELAARIRPSRPEVTFVAVGGGRREEQLRAMAESAGVGDVMRWEGFRSNTLDYLAACDVFLNVSRREGCCNAILEAMAASRPVVAYRVGGNPELVEDLISGRLCEFGDLKCLSRAVLGYLSDPAAAVEAGAQGRRRVMERFLLQHMVDGTLALYRELLSGKGLDRRW